MNNNELSKTTFKATHEVNGLPFNEKEYEMEKATAIDRALLIVSDDFQKETELIKKVIIRKIKEDIESPDSLSTFFMIDDVEYYGDKGLRLNLELYKRLIDFHNELFHSTSACISHVAHILHIEPKIIEII